MAMLFFYLVADITKELGNEAIKKRMFPSAVAEDFNLTYTDDGNELEKK